MNQSSDRLARELDTDVETAAKNLLGCELECLLEGKVVRVRIVETEAYDESDAASHSYKGRTSRTQVMFGPAGYLYVYFTYGLHYCCNVVVGGNGAGAAVLIRAVEPLKGRALIERRRQKMGVHATNGPAKLCQALDIRMHMNGHNLEKLPLRLHITPPLTPEQIVTTKRIGISKAKNVSRRFYIKDNVYVSVK